jgi:hypothetical protein
MLHSWTERAQSPFEAKTASVIWERSFKLPLPDIPLPPLLKTIPPPSGGDLEARLIRYGFQIGLAHGTASQEADAAFQRHVDNSLAIAEGELSAHAAVLDAEIKSLESDRKDAKNKLEEWYTVKGDNFALNLLGDGIVREVSDKLVLVAIVVLWGFEYMLSFRVFGYVFGEPKNLFEFLVYLLAVCFVGALTLVTHYVASALEGEFRLFVPWLGEKTLKIGRFLHLCCLTFAVGLLLVFLLSLTKFRVDAQFSDSENVGVLSTEGLDMDLLGDENPSEMAIATDGVTLDEEQFAVDENYPPQENYTSEPDGETERVVPGDSKMLDSRMSSMSDTMRPAARRQDERAYFYLYGSSLLLIVLAIPMLLKKRADLLRILQYQRAFQRARQRLLTLAQVRATYDSFLVSSESPVNGEGVTGYAKLRQDFAKQRSELLLGFYEQGKVNGQRQRFAGMAKSEIELMLGYEAFGLSSQSGLNGSSAK